MGPVGTPAGPVQPQGLPEISTGTRTRAQQRTDTVAGHAIPPQPEPTKGSGAPTPALPPPPEAKNFWNLGKRITEIFTRVWQSVFRSTKSSIAPQPSLQTGSLAADRLQRSIEREVARPASSHENPRAHTAIGHERDEFLLNLGKEGGRLTEDFLKNILLLGPRLRGNENRTALLQTLKLQDQTPELRNALIAYADRHPDDSFAQAVKTACQAIKDTPGQTRSSGEWGEDFTTLARSHTEDRIVDLEEKKEYAQEAHDLGFENVPSPQDSKTQPLLSYEHSVATTCKQQIASMTLDELEKRISQLERQPPSALRDTLIRSARRSQQGLMQWNRLIPLLPQGAQASLAEGCQNILHKRQPETLSDLQMLQLPEQFERGNLRTVSILTPILRQHSQELEPFVTELREQVNANPQSSLLHSLLHSYAISTT